MNQIFGSLVCWLLPNAVFPVVLFSDERWKDFLSHVLSVCGLYFLVNILAPGKYLGGSHMDAFGVAMAVGLSLLITVLYTLCWLPAASMKEIKDAGIAPGFGEFFFCHLHITPLIYFALSGIFLFQFQKDTPLLWIPFILILLRALDLQARIVAEVGKVELKVAYKLVLEITVLVGVFFPLVIWVLSKF